MLALLSENDQELRNWAVDMIIQIRRDAKPNEVRYWKKPTLIFDPMPKHYRYFAVYTHTGAYTTAILLLIR